MHKICSTNVNFIVNELGLLISKNNFHGGNEPDQADFYLYGIIKAANTS